MQHTAVSTSPFACEAFAALREVPTFKAWDQDEQGTVTLMGTIVVERTAAGGISVTRDGRPYAVPLMMTAKRVREHSHQLLANHFVHDPHPEDLAEAVDRWIAEGVIDRRLSPVNRDYLKTPHALHGMDQAPERSEWRDCLLGAIARGESLSYGKQLVARSLGYARGGSTGVAKLINAFMWSSVLDRDVASATILAHGVKADTDHYAEITADWSATDEDGRERGIAALRRTHRPALAYLTELRAARTAPAASNDNAAFDAVPTSSTLRKGPSARHVIEAGRATMLAAGLRPAVWRMMLRMTDPQLIALRPLVETALKGSSDLESRFSLVDNAEGLGEPCAARMLNRMAELSAETAPATFLRKISFLQEYARRTILPMLHGVLEGGRRLARRGGVKLGAATISQIVDTWTAYAREGNPLATTRNLTWETMQRERVRWHADMANLQGEDDRDLEWAPLIADLSIGRVAVSELCSSEALRTESSEMIHCVASYARRCHDHGVRILSLRIPGTGIRSTLEARRSRAGGWIVVQHQSTKNTKPSARLTACTRQLMAALDEAQRVADQAAAKASGQPLRMAA